MQHVSTFSPQFTARSRQKYLQHLQLTASSPKVSLHLRGRRPHLHFHSFYTNTLLHQPFWQKPPFAPTSFYTNELFHKLAFTHSTFYTNPHLHRPALTQTSFYPKLIVLEPPFAPTFTPTSSCLSLPRPGSANNVEGERERERREKTAIVLKPIYMYIYI